MLLFCSRRVMKFFLLRNVTNADVDKMEGRVGRAKKETKKINNNE